MTMARTPKGKAAAPDPIAALAVGLAADHKAEKAKAVENGEDADPEPAVEGNGDAPEGAEASAADTSSSDAVADPVPPAPGEDHEAVFNRRLDRLTTLVEEAEFESGTALGDMVETMTELFKHRPAVWSAMSASDQRDVVRHLQDVCKSILRKVVLVIAEEDSHTIQGTLMPAFAVKGEAIEGKLKIEGVNDDVMIDVYRLAGHRVVIVSADDKRFSSARREPQIMPDQNEMRFADDGGGKPSAPSEIRSEPPKPPADDADLADEEGTFGVHDAGADEWLSQDRESWTDVKADAGKWSNEVAKGLAKELGMEEDSLDVVDLVDFGSAFAEPIGGDEEDGE